MVYDLGGGTFDVSIIEIGDGVIEVLATAGNNKLGGDDFDNAVTQYMLNDFKAKEGVDLSKDTMALQRLKEAAEKAKKELSSTTQTEINLPYITATAEGPKHFEMTLTRAKFDELTHDLVEKTAEPVKNALSDAGLTASELSKVLLVGGSTRIPAVQDKVKSLTGHEPSKTLNPDECVAIGASIQGGKLAGDAGAGDILLLDVTPLSLSIETMGGIATRLIERNTTIPTKKSQIFSTAADNQTAVDINVVQGERQFARDNKSLGQFRLDGIPPARRGVPQIEVTFDIDANGIVNVSAKDLGTGKEQHITITAGSNMSDEDIDKAVKEAAEFEAQDKKRKDAIDARNEADSMVFQTQKAMDEAGDKLDASDKAAVETDLNALKALVDGSDPENMTDAQVDEIKAAKEKLMESVSFVFQDSKLIKATVSENVKMGKPDASDLEVAEALKIARCDDIIEKLPNGINTVIGTKGVYLSGGEQQRLTIARAVLKNAPVLILDEATAYADPDNEVKVQAAFSELSKGKTVIMIAHRLSTVQNADCIYVISDGKIVESGTHNELMKNNGLYAKMQNDYQSSVKWKVSNETALEG